MNNFEFEKSMAGQMVEILRRNAFHVLRIETATEEQDMKQATDFTFRAKVGTVAARVRRHQSTGKKYRDLTIRSETLFGGRTEIDKLREGFGDYYLYAWQNETVQIGEYMIVDLNKVRESGLLYTPYLQGPIPNTDGATAFVWIPLQTLLDNGCVVCHTVDGFNGKTHRASKPVVMSNLSAIEQALMAIKQQVEPV